ncbi:uncharacterized protein DSM5745_08870 [Aspergillus mulundensis]|uniref:Uncharacterized protein n=1 Tax=Aspergillus mulundensis TaxID=1810919 RepID=A0A3D8R567_9EURO|nr:hypothetical protein DSM5745_08870 [Aspergillus mulundensis]RDW69110.1 hypothetical protein DSM5745_08870 [Aspergillus mulundensis]
MTSAPRTQRAPATPNALPSHKRKSQDQAQETVETPGDEEEHPPNLLNARNPEAPAQQPEYSEAPGNPVQHNNLNHNNTNPPDKEPKRTYPYARTDTILAKPCIRKKPGQRCESCSGASSKCKELSPGLYARFNRLRDLDASKDNLVEASKEFAEYAIAFERRVAREDESLRLLRSINRHLFHLRGMLGAELGRGELDEAQELVWPCVDGGAGGDNA